MSDPVLAARELRVERRSRHGAFTLRVADLALREGEVLVVLGPNGAGKSTLLRALAGLEPLRGGRLVRRKGAAVTLVFQRPAAFAGSVAHNVEAALRGRGLSRKERRRRARAALERFGVAPLAGRRAATLSGGELRRLALARAFATRPDVLLLDEPYDDLDAAGCAALALDLRRAIADTGVALVVVSHELRRALPLADRVAVLLDGRVQQCGPRDEVLGRPVSLPVAALVGMENRIRAVAEPGGWARLDAVHRVPLASRPAPGQPGWAGIRPEHVKLDVGRGEGEPLGKGVVQSLVDDGVTVRVGVAWAGHELCTVLLSGRGLARRVAPGDPVSLSVRPEAVHWIAAEGSGEAGRSD